MSNEPNIAVLPPDGYSYDATVSLDLSNYDEEHPGVVEGNYAVYRITLERKYRIKDADDWNTFCSRLSDNDTYNRFSGETVYLENDITVSSSAGYSQHDFCGIFDGQGHTLTFNYNGSGSDKYVAPFSFVSVAKPAGSSEDDPDVPVTIKNLNVKSTIRNSSVEGDGTHGGFIGVQSKNGGNITLEGCAFIGSLLGADTNNCGGFVGWRTKKITISDSIFAPESVTVSGTGSAVFARSSASVNNSYYFYEFGEDSDNQGKQGYSVTAGENVTLALSGEETQYKVGGITACKNNSGLQYNGTCYAGEEDEVSLTLSHPDTPEGYIFSGYKASAGTLNEGVLTMPAENVTISGGFEFADGVGTRLVGRSISVEGDVGVNFYMELDPEIAASETAYIQFTIPTGDKTETETIPVSEAERKDGCYVFKCDVAAKEMTSNIKAQIIDPESGKSGAVYTYSVKEYADALLSHTEGNWKYTKVAPLVKAMLNYGTAAQRYFDRNPDKLANADLSDEDRMLGEITNQLDAWENYTEDNLSDTTFDGATLSLKSQTSLSLYFTDQEELTFSCVDEKGTERTVETVRNGDTQIARIRDIAAAELQYNFTVSVKKGETELGSVTYSPMNYCYKALHSGGKIIATGGIQAAGIGSGASSRCSNINISGGTVTAIGGQDGAGIGSGGYLEDYGGASCLDITITKDVILVTAIKGENAQAIGN